MKYRITRHLYAVLTIIILIVGCMPVNVLAEDYTATTVRLLRHEGNIEIKDAKGKKRAVLENVRFNSGETLSTGNKSSASIGLDEEKVLTMDEKSSVEFNKKSKKIELNVKSGQVLLDVKKKLNADEQLEVKTSTMSIGIRGTIVCIQAPELIEQSSPDSNQNPSGSDQPGSSSEQTESASTQTESGANQVEPTPNQTDSASTQTESGPNQAESVPDQITPTSNQTTSGTDRTLSATTKDISAPTQYSAPNLNLINPNILSDSPELPRLFSPTNIMLLEGRARVTLPGVDGSIREITVEAGQKLEIRDEAGDGYPDEEPECVPLRADDLNPFLLREINNDPVMKSRVAAQNNSILEDAMNQVDDDVYGREIRLVAQSASKLYDGQPLTRKGDVLVYGLPEYFTIDVSATGSITDAGAAPNPVGKYWIYDAESHDVTARFKNVKTESGILIVDPAPLTVWTGSAQKTYDGKPLTCNQAGLDNYPVHEEGQPEWRNLSYATVGLEQSFEVQTLYGICGTVWVHGTNPLTKENQKIELKAGQKLTVWLSDEGEGKTIKYLVTKVSEKDIPEEVLRLYNDNPDLLEQACSDAKWSKKSIKDMINELSEKQSSENGNAPENAQNAKKDINGTQEAGVASVTNARSLTNGTNIQSEANETNIQSEANGTNAQSAANEEKYDLKIDKDRAGSLIKDSTNVRINIDTKITDYNDRPLGSEESHFIEIKVADSIKVYATGSQTKVGESENTYRIDWGRANKSNYIINENLGRLKVNPAVTSRPTGSSTIRESVPVSRVVETDSSGSETPAPDPEKPTPEPEKPKYEMSVTLKAASADKVYDGTALTAGSATASGLPDGFTYEAVVVGSQKDAGRSENTIKSYKILKDGQDVTDQFTNVNLEKGSLTITKAPVTVKTGSSEKDYDGTALTNASASINGLVSGEKADVAATGSITDVGFIDNTYEIIWDTAKKENYEITEDLGRLTVNPMRVSFALRWSSATLIPDESGSEDLSGSAFAQNSSLAAVVSEEHESEELLGSVFAQNSDLIESGRTRENLVGALQAQKRAEVGYKGYIIVPESFDGFYQDGSPVDCEEEGYNYDDAGNAISTYGIYNLIGGVKLRLEAAGYKDAGTYSITPEATFSGGNSGNYDLNFTPDTLVINPIAATVWTGSDNKVYDGEPLTCADAGINGTVGDDADGITVSATGTITEPGTADNTYTIAWGSVNPDNYVLTEDLGTLTVLEAYDAPVVLTAASADKTYDGTVLEDSTVTASGLGEGFTLEATVEGSQTDAGSSDNEITGYKILKDGEDVTEQFTNVTLKKGTLTVSKAAAKVETGSAEKEYDGTALTNATATITGLASGETATVTAIGTITDAGFVYNSYEIAWGSAKADNYEITEKLGKLTVSKAVAKVETGSAENDYDGTALTNEAATITGLVSGETATVTATGTITDADTTDNTYEINWGTAKADNYKITEDIGTLKVNPLKVTFELYCTEVEYDGYIILPECFDGYYPDDTSVDCEEDGYIYEDIDIPSAIYGIYNLTGGGKLRLQAGGYKDVGTYTITPEATFSSGKAENYDITYKSNTMVIAPATAIVWTGSDRKVYDGEPLTCADAGIDDTVGEDHDKITVTATGTITDPGTADNTYTIDWGSVNSDNYVLSEDLGTLTVLEAYDTPVVLTAASADKTYDGTVLEDSTVTATGLGEDFTIEATVEGSRTDAGSSENEITGYKILKDGEDVTEQFTNVTLKKGTLTVSKAAAKVETGSAEKDYDGTALTNATATITGLVSGETATVTATGTITDADTTDNIYEIEWGTAKADNYEITEELGTLTVNPLQVTFNLCCPEESVEYQGFRHVPEWIEGYYKDGNDVGEGTIDHIYDSNDRVMAIFGEFTLRGGASLSLYADGCTDVGTYTIVPEAIFSKGKAENYDITYEFNEMTIYPFSFTVVTGSDEKVYDGEPLTCPDVKIVDSHGDTRPETDWNPIDIELGSITITATGTITDPGDVPNFYSIDWGSANPDNYSVSDDIGTLSVYPNDPIEPLVGMQEDDDRLIAEPDDDESFVGMQEDDDQSIVESDDDESFADMQEDEDQLTVESDNGESFADMQGDEDQLIAEPDDDESFTGMIDENDASPPESDDVPEEIAMIPEEISDYEEVDP